VASARSGPRAKALKCMGKENACANQAQQRCNRLNHRKDPLRPRPGQNDIRPRTVKRIPRRGRNSGLTDALIQQICPETGCERTAADSRRSLHFRNAVNWQAASATIDSPPHGSPHFRRVRDAISSYLDADVGCIGAFYGRAARVGTRPAEW